MNQPIATFSRFYELDHNVPLWFVAECDLRRAQAMAKLARRVPQWLTIDLMILTVGGSIMIVAFVWLLVDFP